MNKAPDRINVTLGMKLPGPQEYSSINFSVSYSADALPGEIPEQCFQRILGFVDAKCDELMEKIKGIGNDVGSTRENDFEE